MRRPLAAAALLFITAVRLVTLLHPLPVPEPDRPDGQRAAYTGTVSDIICYTDTKTGEPVRLVYLENAASETVSEPSESLSSSRDTQIPSGPEPSASFRIICRLTENSYLPRIGSRIRCSGEVSCFREATNPGEFDAKAYYNRQGYAFELREASVTGTGRNYSRYRQALWLAKSRMGQALELLLSPEDASVMKAMLLGEKKGMDQEIKSLYQAAGISHVVAISGLHISILGMGVYNLLSRLSGRIGGPGSGRLPACIASALFLLSFLFMTGFSASSMRAGIMFALSLTAKLLGRTYDTATALAVAAALLLTENPAWIDDTGFQLSFTAALAASIAVPAFSRMDSIKDWLLKRSSGGNIQRYRQHGSVRFLKDSSPAALKKAFVCPRKDIPQALWKIAGTHLPALWNRLAETLSSGFRSSFCVSMVTLPLVLSSFYEWNVLSVAVNLVVIPLMGMLLGCCILLASLGGLLLTAGEEWLSLLAPAALPVKGILFLYETLCRLGSTGGIGLFRPGAPQLWQSLLFYVCLFALFCFAGKLPRIAGYVFCSLLCLIFLAGKPAGVQVTMLDVGQGDCIYIRTQEGEHYLCDGGSTSKLQTGTWQVIPFLKHQGVRRLELIFVSHCDTDHVSAIRELLEWAGDGKAKIGGLVLAASGTEDEMRASLVKAAEKNGVPVYRMEAGDQIRRGSALFQAVYPFSENNASGGASTDRNASSLVLRFSQLRGSKTPLSDTDTPGEGHSEEAFSLLLTGDAEAGGEKQILERCPELISGCTILKTAHHGSDTSTSQAFLDAVSPRAALISCGKDNSYGHPHEEVLSRLKTAGIPVFITAECGAITIRERNGTVTAETFLRPGAGRTEAAAAGPAGTG